MFAEWYEFGPGEDAWPISIPTPGSERGLAVVYVDVPGGTAKDFSVETAILVDPGADDMDGGMATAMELGMRREALGAKNAVAFSATLTANAESIEVTINKSLLSRVRVFVGWIRERWPDDPCDRCRALLKAAIRIGRAATGTLGLEDAVEMAELLNWELPQWFSDFMERFFDEGIWDRLRRIADRLRTVTRAIDQLVLLICRELDYCPQH